MSEAAVYLDLNFRTFKRIASEYNLYKPSPNAWQKRYELEDILFGKHHNILLQNFQNDWLRMVY